MTFEDFDAAAKAHSAEITRDVLERRAADFNDEQRPDIAELMTEYRALFQHLLSEATLLAFTAGYQEGALKGMFESAAPRPH